jgi:hypothetical protein
VSSLVNLCFELFVRTSSALALAVGETLAVARSFVLKNFIHIVDVLQLRMDCVLRTGFPAEAAGDAKLFFDSNLHSKPTLF